MVGLGMKQLVKVNNSELSFRLNLNYNNVFARLKMLLGVKASVFADLVTKSTYTIWYTDGERDFRRMSDAPEEMRLVLETEFQKKIQQIAKELKSSSELLAYVDDILEVPDESFVFYTEMEGQYDFVLAAWGCRHARTTAADFNNGFVRRLVKKPQIIPKQKDEGEDIPEKDPVPAAYPGDDKNSPKEKSRKNPQKKPEREEKSEDDKDAEIDENIIKEKDETPEHEMSPERERNLSKKQHVVLRVLDQHTNPVVNEEVMIRTLHEDKSSLTDERGCVDVGDLNYSEVFSVFFPHLDGVPERNIEVESGIEYYDTYIKKLVKYAPVLFIEDKDGHTVQNYDVKIIIGGQETLYNSGHDGMLQLPLLLDGQKFIVVDTANYANSEEFFVSQNNAKPYVFRVSVAEKKAIGITVVDKKGRPIPNVVIDIASGNIPCRKETGMDGRAEFPPEAFQGNLIPLNIICKGKNPVKHNLEFFQDMTEYSIKLQNKGSFPKRNWMWLLLLPVLLLLGWGIYHFMDKTPTWEELNKGVVLIKTEEFYSVSTGLSENTGLSRLYFNYSPNERKILNATFDKNEAKISYSWGTGFFISKDGQIATNRHIADPIPPEEQIVSMLKQHFVFYQEYAEKKVQELQKIMNQNSAFRYLSENNRRIMDELQDSLDYYKNMSRYFDQIIKLSNYKVESHCNIFVAFDNSMIKTFDDRAFHPCTCLASGNPGDVNSNDVAIIQLNEKEKIMPKDAYIFKVPEKDPFADNKEDNEDYEVWVLGYNAGADLAGTDLGIHPQHFKGNISSTNDKYLVQYNMATIGGSSGSPVLNKKRELVGINNSGYEGTNIKYGVRTTYLYDLMKEINEKRNITNE